MVNKKRETRKGKTEKPITPKEEKSLFIKATIFTVAVIILIILFHTFFSSSVLNRFQELKEQPADAGMNIDVKVDMISINGEKSPNLIIEINTKDVSRIKVELLSGDFHDSVEDGYSVSHNLNLILPESLIGKDLEVKITSYDSLNRKSEHTKIYSITS